MIESDVDTAIKPLISQYKKRLGSSALDIREGIALVDLHLRLAYTVVIANSRRPLITPIKLVSSPGFGTMLAVVREGSKQPVDLGTKWITSFVTGWSKEIVSAVDKFKLPKFANFKFLRDRLSHGSPLPSDDKSLNALRTELEKLLNALESGLEKSFDDLTIVEKEGNVYVQKKKERAVLEISPLWVTTADSTGVCIYSHCSQDGIHYLNPQGDIYSERSEEAITKFIKTLIGDKAGSDLGKLVQEVISDIAAYTEDYSKPSYFFGDEEDRGTLHIPWTRSTSEGNDPRLDSFRIGPDSRREWLDGNLEWRAYSDFLKNISNWQILARRMGIGLANFTSERDAEESSRLGLSNSFTARGPALLRKHRDVPESSGEAQEEFHLMQKIDDSCQKIKPSTSVYFLIGQAGLGKTELMVTLARQRASEIEQNPSIKLPLYLFVSSTGRTLSSLEDAVNSALNITKVLSSQSAKALCRNGLLVLLVDGFDELLGSSGYENALGSLEPWFKELGGRGVLVASARSSYYLTQYRRSLALATHLNVDHTLAELQPWTKSASEEYLKEMGVSIQTLSAIKERDWKILSVPFFAKAFAAWVSRQHKSDRSIPSIYEVVVDQYLDREARKLTDPSAGSLLTTSELRVLFSEAAELMQSSRNREIEQSDLIMCAESVVNVPNLDLARPGLTRRITSLCGLGVTTDSNGQNQFGFSHEVLFDCFLSLAIQHRLSGVINTDSFLSLLKTGAVNISVFEWLMERKPQETIGLAKKIKFSVSDPQNNQVLSGNLGALWEVILKAQNGVPVSDIACGLQLENISFSESGWTKINLSHSTIQSLKIPNCNGVNINISESKIDYLESTPQQARSIISGIKSAQIHSLYIGEFFGEGRIQVRKIFEELGLVPATSIDGTADSEIAYDILERLARRPDIPVILDRDDLSVDDQRLSWISHLGIDEWRKFVNALVESGAARLEGLATSGRPKVRLIFNKGSLSLIDPLAERSEEAKQFWGRL
ncbi:hypothetical protein M2426_004120 [Pseudomonas moraviensis]|uniref:NACHT domain-containing protein n=1 Tax=Pseudomonas moraviensis TaxID=321662 RepID=UPI003D1C8329